LILNTSYIIKNAVISTDDKHILLLDSLGFLNIVDFKQEQNRTPLA